MKILKSIALIGTLSLLMMSCSVTNKTVRTAEISSNIRQYPCVADLDVKNVRVQKSCTWNWSFGEPTLNSMKETLIADLLKENGGDILLEPRFTFKKEFFGERVLTVEGFSARFKNFRNASVKDLEALEMSESRPEHERNVYMLNR